MTALDMPKFVREELGLTRIEITNPPADIGRGAQFARDIIAANLAR